MKGRELAGYLLKHPDWNVQFLFTQEPDEISAFYDRWFDIVDVGDRTEHNTTVLIGKENEK
jgi:hypothetical protein